MDGTKTVSRQETHWFDLRNLLALLLVTGCSITPDAALEMDRQFEARLDRALTASQKFQVRYRNSVGEGPDGWDVLPETPVSEVNCITWLNYVLGESFGKTPLEVTDVLTSLKYYGGIKSFGTRKHFVDQWMAFDPGPLKAVDLSHCAKIQIRNVSLDPAGFARRVGYSCPLFLEDATQFRVQYVTPEDFQNCAQTLAPGAYVFFLVPEDWYMKKYGKVSGPMGLVHGEILRVFPATLEGAERKMTVFNASLRTHQVESYPLREVLAGGLKGFSGLALFRVDPRWDWRDRALLSRTPDLTCEQKLIASGSRKTSVAPEAWEDHQGAGKK